MAQGLPLKLNIEDGDVDVGGVNANSVTKIEWSDEMKTADTVLRDEIVSTQTSKELMKGKITLELWQIGEIEKENRTEGKLKGTLTGLILPITFSDKYGRSFSSPKNRFEKGSGNIDAKAEDDKVTLEFTILDVKNFEAKIHAGE